MFRHILLDDDTWLITVGVLGGVRVYYRPRARICKVHSGERRHLYDIADELRKAGVLLDRDSEAFAALLREFAERVLLRGDREWRKFFIDSTARQIAEQLTAAYPVAQTVRMPAGGRSATGLRQRLWLTLTPANLRLLLPVRNRVR